MTPTGWEIREDHVLTLLHAIPSESIHCVVTSPPYWGLRAYKTEPQIWGGSVEHKHQFSVEHCTCGAWRGELGLEPTPELYVQHLVEVFREVKRVLRKDGTLWCNLGDSYTSGGRGTYPTSDQIQHGKQSTHRAWNEGDRSVGTPRPEIPVGLKPKDLCGMPWRVAFALQADGWWLRSDIIWAKPNPMPESVTDRPTKSHEYVFLLSKSPRYFFDQEAVRLPFTDSTIQRVMQDTFHDQDGGEKTKEFYKQNPNRSARRSLENLRKQFDKTHAGSGSSYPGHSGYFKADGTPTVNPAGRNLRTVWTIPTQPYSEAHFATFPEKLVEPCIRAGTSERGCCATCGAPWEREVQKEYGEDHSSTHHIAGGDRTIGQGWEGTQRRATVKSKTIGWHPTCSCHADTKPCVCLDPFAGSGTVGVVALKLQRDFLGLELNPAYVQMARKRIGAVMPLFASAS